MSLSGYECTCANGCTCFDNIKADPVTEARMMRVSNAIERLRVAEYHSEIADSEEFAIRLEALAGEFGL